MKNKILFLLPSPPPLAGPEIVAYQILNSTLIKSRNDIVFINSNIRKNNSSKGKLNFSGIFAFWILYLRFLRALFSVDIVFMYLSSSRVGFIRDTIYILTCWLFRKKCVAHYHGSRFKEFHDVQSKILRKFIKYSLSKLSLLLVLGSNIKSSFSNIYQGEIDVLYNGIDVDEYRPNKIKSDFFTITFIGHLTYPKGFYHLVRAYKHLYNTNKNLRFRFAGSNHGHCEHHYTLVDNKQFLKKNQSSIYSEIDDFISNAAEYNAEYLGFIGEEEKVAILNQTDLFVLPSFTEGFSMSCLEAAAMKIPIVTTPVGAMEELVIDGYNGCIVEVGSVEDLSKAIKLLSNDVNMNKEFASNSRLIVEDKYCIEDIVERLIDLLK